MEINNSYHDFYSLYKSKIDLCYFNIKEEYSMKIYKLIIIELLIIIFLVSVFIFYKIYINNSYTLIILIFEVISLIYSILYLLVNVLSIKSKLYIRFNKELYKYLLDYFSNNDFIYEENTELDKDEFKEMNLFNLDILNYEGSNFTASNKLNKKFIFCDVNLYDVMDRIKKDVYYNSYENIKYITHYYYQDRIDIFKGLYYETTINRENNEYIFLIPDNITDKFIRHNINHYLTFDGKIIKLENLEFEKRYAVYSLNEIKSRYVLSLTLMEKINELDRLIPNKKYLVFKSDGRVGIFIDSYSIEKILGESFKISKDIPRMHIRKIFNEIDKLFKISVILEDIR